MVPGLLNEELSKRDKYFHEMNLSETAFTRDSWVNLKLVNEQMRAPNGSGGSTVRLYVKYIQCQAATPIRIIAKLVRNKHSVPTNYKVSSSYPFLLPAHRLVMMTR